MFVKLADFPLIICFIVKVLIESFDFDLKLNLFAIIHFKLNFSFFHFKITVVKSFVLILAKWILVFLLRVLNYLFCRLTILFRVGTN